MPQFSLVLVREDEMKSLITMFCGLIGNVYFWLGYLLL
jgi:hypothetical protein